ncbi:MAG: excinuclease ABC subunit UvrC [Candidatus Hydrogenedentes bacterium]|nr:excinuclease ABC subunit UvrC [Candidatus Hydrogenedentota bacterium]
MEMPSEIASLERIDLGGAPAARRSPDEFLASFDLDRVPAEPGCYLMHDRHDRVVYVGKAKNLRARVRAYINESDTRQMVQFLMRRVAHIDFLVTTNEKEALLLENSLIKRHKPRYNVRLRDDKTYVSLRVNVQHEFPRITVTRTCRRDGARYFGPYSSAAAVRETLRELQRIFPLRTCSDNVLRNRARPCLYHQMKQCCAPCVGYVERDAYHEIVNQVLLVLEGRSADVEKLLLARIERHAAALEFEKAAELRDRLFALRETFERQRAVAAGSADERDVFGVYTHGRFSEIQVLFYRGGKMIGGRSFSISHRDMPLSEVFGSFLLQYYSEAPYVPTEILTPVPLDEGETLAEILSEQRGRKVSVHWPQRGEKRALTQLAERNAKSSFDEKRLAEKANADLLERVREALKLSRAPARIECYDISSIQGDKPVGSMVAFEHGLPAKSRYRRFAIKRVEGQDDFAMLREVLLRRLQRAIQEDDLPDLLLIDGGKGQLNVATALLKDLGIEDLDAAGIAKSRTGDEGRSPERFFIPGRANPVILPQHSPVVLLLARIRDEAHRFAITYHRKRRSQATLRSPLLAIPGIGEKRARILLAELGSVARIRNASVEAIAAIPGFDDTLAKQIKKHLAAPGGARKRGTSQ